MEYNKEELIKLENWIDEYIENKAREYKYVDMVVKKVDHIKRTVDIAKKIEPTNDLLRVAMKFHDIGRFEQYERIESFDDKVMSHYALGKGGLYLDGVNTFIVTFDVNGLSGVGERNQGYFNAGLYSTNLVNAFHSLGIGTCFIQFANSVKDEDDLKRKNEIPEYERIAVILFAGYYDEKSIFAVSPRKNVSELLIEHK